MAEYNSDIEATEQSFRQWSEVANKPAFEASSSSWSTLEVKQHKLGERLKARAEEKRKRDQTDIEAIKAKIEEICGKSSDEGYFGETIMLSDLEVHDPNIVASVVRYLEKEGIEATLKCKNAKFCTKPCSFDTCFAEPDRIELSWW
jgi:hypothetical protein